MVKRANHLLYSNIAMICGQVQVFQVARLPKTEYTMTKFPATQCHYMVHGRVLTLVLLGRVKAFPIVYPLKPGVMGGLC
jgi:hypothetical protein